MSPSAAQGRDYIDSSYAWLRLAINVAIGTVGGVGMWSIVVAMPAIQAEFGSDRGSASLPFTLLMVGLAPGTVLMGKLADRFGVVAPVMLGSVMLATGYMLSAFAPDMTLLTLIFGLFIGMLGTSAFFAPLMTDISFWFQRRRGFAIGLCASGNYFAGAIWPPAIEHFIALYGWRATHIGIGAICLCIILPLALLLRRKPPAQPALHGAAAAGARGLHLPPRLLQTLLILAGLGCCVAMSMPQVHIVAYCVDLGYGPARGAEMLALMLGCGIVSRMTSGWILDRIGGLATLLLGAVMQGLALALYLPFDGLMSLYVISAIFGLVQGGIVPSYAFIIRELFPAHQAGFRVSLVISATLIGMALGGWLSGAIFDFTGSYRVALLNGIAWNLMNVSIVTWLLLRGRRLRPAAAIA